MDRVCLLRRGCDHEAGLVFAKPQGMSGQGSRQTVELDTKVAGKRHLGNCYEESTVRGVMHCRNVTASDQASDAISGALLCIEIDGRRRTLGAVQHDLHVERLAEMASLRAKQHQNVAG